MMEFIYFVLLILGVLYLPGKFILRILKFESNNILISRFLSFGVGITVFLLATYFLAYLGLSFAYNIFVIIAVIFELMRLRIRELALGVGKTELLILALGIVGMSYLTVRSGIISGNIVQFFSSSGVDYIYHLSLIGNLTHDFPPTQPSISGLPLRGYHFFYDFLVANFVSFYKLNIVDALFRYFPIFLSFLYGLSGLALARFLRLKKLATLLFLFLLYFANSFQFVFRYLGLNGEYNSGTNSQLVYIVDPSVLLSIIILFCAFIIIFSKKKNLILSAVLFGILPQVKIYMAVVAYIALGILSVKNIYKERNFDYLKIVIIGGIISAIIYLPNNFGAGGLIFAPLLYYKHFMETSPVFEFLKWPFKYQVFELYHNYPRLGILYAVAIVLMLIPSMGLRLVSILDIKKIMNRKNYTDENIFFGIIILCGFLFVTFFIQSVAVFNIIQFLWISYTLLLIPTAITLGRLAGNSSVIKVVIVFALVVLLSIPENARVLDAFTNDLKSIDKSLMIASGKVKDTVDPTEKILLLRRPGFGVPVVSALTSRSVYYESAGLEFANTEEELKIRSEELSVLEKKLDSCQDSKNLEESLRNFMNKNNLSFIFSMQNEICLSQMNIFEQKEINKPYELYKLK